MGINHSLPSIPLEKDVEEKIRRDSLGHSLISICSRLVDSRLVKQILPTQGRSQAFHAAECSLNYEDRKRVEHALRIQYAEVKSGLLNVRKLSQLLQHYLLETLAFPGEASHFEACRTVVKRLFYLWTPEYHIGAFADTDHMVVRKIDKPLEAGICGAMSSMLKEIDRMLESTKSLLRHGGEIQSMDFVLKALMTTGQCAMLSSDHCSAPWLHFISSCAYLLNCSCLLLDEFIREFARKENSIMGDTAALENFEGRLLHFLHKSFVCSVVPFLLTTVSLMEHHTEMCIQLLPIHERFVDRLSVLIDTFPTLKSELQSYQEGVTRQLRCNLQSSGSTKEYDGFIWSVAPKDRLIMLLRMAASSLGYMVAGVCRGKSRSDEEENSRPWVVSGLFSGGAKVRTPFAWEHISGLWETLHRSGEVDRSQLSAALRSYDLVEQYARFRYESDTEDAKMDIAGDHSVHQSESKELDEKSDTDLAMEFATSMFEVTDTGSFSSTEKGSTIRKWLAHHRKLNPVERRYYGHDRFETAEVLILTACLYHGGSDEVVPLWETAENVWSKIANNHSFGDLTPPPSLRQIWNTVFTFRQWLGDMKKAYNEASEQIDSLEQENDEDEQMANADVDVDEDAKDEEMDHTAEEADVRRQTRTARANSIDSTHSSTGGANLHADRIKRINPIEHPTSFESFYSMLLQRLSFLCGHETRCPDWLHELSTSQTEGEPHCFVRLNPASSTPGLSELKAMSAHARSMHTLVPHPFRALHPREWAFERISNAIASTKAGFQGDDAVYSPCQRRCKAIEIYAKEGWAFPVNVASSVLFAQQVRGHHRYLAFDIGERLLRNCNRPLVRRDIIVPFRSSLRGMSDHEEISALLPLVKIIGQADHCSGYQLDRRMAISQPSGLSTPSSAVGRKFDHETASQSSDHEHDLQRLKQQIDDAFELELNNDSAEEEKGEEEMDVPQDSIVRIKLPAKVCKIIAHEHHPFGELDCLSVKYKNELEQSVCRFYRTLSAKFRELTTPGICPVNQLLSLHPIMTLFTLDWRVAGGNEFAKIDACSEDLRIVMQLSWNAWLNSTCFMEKGQRTTEAAWQPVSENNLWLCLSQGLVSRHQVLAYIWTGVKTRGAKLPKILENSLVHCVAGKCRILNGREIMSLRSEELSHFGEFLDIETLLLSYLDMVSQTGVLSRAEAQKMFEDSCSELSLLQNTKRSLVQVPSVSFLQDCQKEPHKDITVNSINLESDEITAAAYIIRNCSGLVKTDSLPLFAKQLFGLHGLLSIYFLGESLSRDKPAVFFDDCLQLVLAAMCSLYGTSADRSFDPATTPFGEWNHLCECAVKPGLADEFVDGLVQSGLVHSETEAAVVSSLIKSTDSGVLCRLAERVMYFILSLLDRPEKYVTNHEYSSIRPLLAPKGLAILFSVLRCGSVSLLRAVLPILQRLLPAVSPFTAGCSSRAIAESRERGSIGEWIASTMQNQPDGDKWKATTEHVPKLLLAHMSKRRCFFPLGVDVSMVADDTEGGFGYGHQLSTVCSMIVSVLRTLLRLRAVSVTVRQEEKVLFVEDCQARVSEWGRSIINVLRRGLLIGKKALDNQSELSSTLSSNLGYTASALWTLGGLPELLRPGARVIQKHQKQDDTTSGINAQAETADDDAQEGDDVGNSDGETGLKVELEEENDIGVIVQYERGAPLALVALPCGESMQVTSEDASSNASTGSKNFWTSLTEGSMASSQYSMVKLGNTALNQLLSHPTSCQHYSSVLDSSPPSFHNEELNSACEDALKMILRSTPLQDNSTVAVCSHVLLEHQSSLESWELVWQPLNQLRALDEIPLIDYSLNMKATSMQSETAIPDVAVGEGFIELLSEFAAYELPHTALHTILQHQYHTTVRRFPPMREISSENTLYMLTWMWKLKSMATSSISSIFRQQFQHIETAIFRKILPTIMETALRPLPLPSRGPGFLDLSNLAHIVHVNWERTVESHLSRNNVRVWGLSRAIRESSLSNKDLDCSEVAENLSINVGGTRNLANALFLHRDYLAEGLDALPVHSVEDADIANDYVTNLLDHEDSSAEPGSLSRHTPKSQTRKLENSADSRESLNAEHMCAPPPGVDLTIWNNAYNLIDVSNGRSIEDCYIALKQNQSPDEAALWLLQHPASQASIAAERERLRLHQEAVPQSSADLDSSGINASAVVEGVHMNEPLIPQNGLVAADPNTVHSFRGRYALPARVTAEKPARTGQNMVESIPGLVIASDAPLVCMSEAIMLPVSNPSKLKPGTLVAIVSSPVVAATDREFSSRIKKLRRQGHELDSHAKRNRATVLQVAYPLAARFLGAGCVVVGTVAPPNICEHYRRYWESLASFLGTEERRYSSQDLVFVQYRPGGGEMYRTVGVPFDQIRVVMGSYGEDVSVSSMSCGESLRLWGRMNVMSEEEEQEKFLKHLDENKDIRKRQNDAMDPTGNGPIPTQTMEKSDDDDTNTLDTDTWMKKILSTNGNDPNVTSRSLGFGQLPLLCRSYESYAIQSARQACLHVLLQWPESIGFDPMAFGGAKSLLGLVKVIVAGVDGMFSGEGARLAVVTQKVSQNFGSGTDGNSKVMDSSVLGQHVSASHGSGSRLTERNKQIMSYSLRDVIPVLRRQIATLVKAEQLQVPDICTDAWLCKRCGLKNRHSAHCRACSNECEVLQRTAELTPYLIKDAKRNMKVISVSSTDVNADSNKNDVVVAESKHPATMRKKACIHISGATAMWITFDQNTCTDPQDPTAYLAFYLDASRTHCVAKFAGSAHAFRPFLVRTPTGKLFYTYSPSARTHSGDTRWGFKLYAHRANGMAWGGERETLRFPSLEWGTWLIGFLLSECLPEKTLAKGVIHNATLVRVMLKHICSHAAPFKQRIVGLLCRLLSQPSYFSSDENPPLHIILNGIKSVLDEKLRTAPPNGIVFLPTALLQVYELVATASAANFMLKDKWQFFTPVTSLVPTPLLRLRQSSEEEQYHSVQKGITDLSVSYDNWFPPVMVESAAPEIPRLQALRPLNAMVFAREILKSLAVGSRLPDSWLIRAAELAHDGGPNGTKFSVTAEKVANLQRAMVAISSLSLMHRTGMLNAFVTSEGGSQHTPSELKAAALWNIPMVDRHYVDGNGRDRNEKIPSPGLFELIPGILEDHSHRVDEELVEWASMRASKEEIRVSTLRISNIELTSHERHSYPSLNCLSAEVLRIRLALFVILNRLLSRCLVLVDTSGSVGEWSVGALLKQVSHVIFSETKSEVIESAIEQSAVCEESSIHVTLDNAAAARSIESGKNDIESSQCIFAQLFRHLRPYRAKALRSRVDSKDRLFKVSFANEPGEDWGGIFRDVMYRAVGDLFNLPDPHINLFQRVRSALLAEEQGNAADDDTWIPNIALFQGSGASTSNSKTALYMLQFVGVLMGISWRMKSWLDFMFAPCVWKLIAGDETQLDESDIEMLDPEKGALLKQLRGFLTGMGIDMAQSEQEIDVSQYETLFSETFGELYFVDEDEKGRPEELITNGASTRVTAANASSFCQMIAERRLGPLRKPIRAIRKGLLNIIPERAVQLCRWKDVQIMVCGPSEIDMAMLQRHTRYLSPLSPNHEFVKRFWNVFASLSMRERSMLIRYAWGRSKLPRGDENWVKGDGRRLYFLLSPLMDENLQPRGDDSLVEAHTCFFQLKTPLYSTEEILKQKMMQSVRNGLARGTFDLI